jgi:hypothetical protein
VLSIVARRLATTLALVALVGCGQGQRDPADPFEGVWRSTVTETDTPGDRQVSVPFELTVSKAADGYNVSGFFSGWVGECGPLEAVPASSPGVGTSASILSVSGGSGHCQAAGILAADGGRLTVYLSVQAVDRNATASGDLSAEGEGTR